MVISYFQAEHDFQGSRSAPTANPGDFFPQQVKHGIRALCVQFTNGESDQDTSRPCGYDVPDRKRARDRLVPRVADATTKD
jgi:hypothetical protein